MRKVREVVVQKWEESERDWGTRPDGYSLHLTETDRMKFIEGYWAGMPDEVPDEYSRPDGDSYIAEVDEDVFEQVKTSEHGVRFYSTPPGSGGPDGWVPLRRPSQAS